MAERRRDVEPGQDSNKVEDFLELESVDRSASFPLLEEKNEQGELLKANAQWLRLVDGSNSTEGKLFVPQAGKISRRELVIHSPGLPGDSVTDFEARRVPEMIDSGFSVFSTRHNGLVVDAKAPPRCVHCPEKEQWAEKQGQKNLGDTFGFELAGHEVATAIKALEGSFDKIHCVGHSGGALFTFSSLIHIAQERPDLLSKIDKVVSMAGVVGPYDYELMTKILEWIKENGFYDMIDPSKNIMQLQQQIGQLSKFDWSSIPNMQTMFLIPGEVLGGEKDEYVDPTKTKNFADLMRDQGCNNTRVVDYSSRHIDRAGGKESHDLSSRAPQVALMRWLTGEFAENYKK